MRQQRRLSLEVLAAIGGSRHTPRPPLSEVRISVTRHSAGELDPDGLYATVKSLLDVMCVRSSRHPVGLGIIADDTNRMITLDLSQQPAKRGQQFTRVVIEHWSDIPT